MQAEFIQEERIDGTVVYYTRVDGYYVSKRLCTKTTWHKNQTPNNTRMSPAIIFGWSLLFAAAYEQRTEKDEDIRIAAVTVLSSVALGCFLGHFLDAVFA
jgi:hypothetical protein